MRIGQLCHLAIVAAANRYDIPLLFDLLFSLVELRALVQGGLAPLLCCVDLYHVHFIMFWSPHLNQGLS